MRTKDIGVFVDESGTLDVDQTASRFYFVCMVFHDQQQNIATNLARAKLGTPGGLSLSENTFFDGAKNLKKNYLKLLDRKLVK